MLAVSFTNGLIYLMQSYDDLAPVHINTELNGELGFLMEWSNSRELLAVAGTVKEDISAYNAPSAAAEPAAEAASRRATATPVKPTYSRLAEPIHGPKLSVTIPSASAATTPSPTSHSSMHSSSSAGPSTSGINSNHNGNATTHNQHPPPKPPPIVYTNQVKFYNQSGQLLFSVAIPPGPAGSPVSALTWGHSDKRLFVATGPQIHIAWVSRRVASLQLLCRLQIQRSVGSESALSILPLPSRMKSLIGHLYAQTIQVRRGRIFGCAFVFLIYFFKQTSQCVVPNALSLRDFVSRPPLGTRLHCTMIRHDEDKENNSGICYTLYLEYLGGLVPLLKGKRTSKIRPEFVIFDPQNHGEHIMHHAIYNIYHAIYWLFYALRFIFLTTSARTESSTSTLGSIGDKTGSNSSSLTASSSMKTDTSDSDADTECGKANTTPRPQRKRRIRSLRRRHHSSSSANGGGGAAGTNGGGASSCPADSRTTSQPDADDELAYVDTLPEEIKLVEVNSNIWGTKFKIHGIAKNLPANLGQISYKTSLLHLQPRQMTVVVTELRDDVRVGPDPNFNPHIFSEDEDDVIAVPRALPIMPPLLALSTPSSPTPLSRAAAAAAAAAATTDELLPRGTAMQRPNRLLPQRGGAAAKPSSLLGPLARAESYEDDVIALDGTNAVDAALPPLQLPPPLQPQPAAAAAAATVSNPARPASGISSYTSLVTQYSRSSSSNSSGQSSSRHAISPLCSDGAVPTLQSPKNAVAPSDIIFDRPPPSGVHSLSSSASGSIADGTSTLMSMSMQMKSCLFGGASSGASQQQRKRGDAMHYIDEDVSNGGAAAAAAIAAATPPVNPTVAGNPAQSLPANNVIITQAIVEPIMHRTSTIVSIAPLAIVRSCSAGFLDSVDMIPSDGALSILRREVPGKRLVLIDARPTTAPASTSASSTSAKGRGSAAATAAAVRHPAKKKSLSECGKSKSLDSCDLRRVLVKPETVAAQNASGNNALLSVPMPRVHETSETEDSASDVETGFGNRGDALNSADVIISAPLNGERDFMIFTPSAGSPVRSAQPASRHLHQQLPPPPQQPTQTSQRVSQPFCIKCRILSRECQCKSASATRKSHGDDSKLAVRAKKEATAVTSFADSPLFTRKHRFGSESNGGGGPLSAGASNGSAGGAAGSPRSPNRAKKNEFSFSFLKQISEARRRKRDEQAGASREEREVQEQIDVEPPARDDRAHTSLHAQALSTLENIISRLRDLEDSGAAGDTNAAARLPRSSPASPALSKKKRNAASTSSPIRQFLNSPLLSRRNRKKQQLIDSSDEETPLCSSLDDGSKMLGTGKKERQPYQDLETFQKAQLRQKVRNSRAHLYIPTTYVCKYNIQFQLKRGKIEPNGLPSVSQPAVLRREFVMHNKAPMWNENSQVYQLDFGGRVTQESAKNFQIEFRGQQVTKLRGGVHKVRINDISLTFQCTLHLQFAACPFNTIHNQQVMQFGRIDGNAYTLDFQYPFSALQAFSVALANVTQRLK